jgi:phosphatidate cytidylyltransferase
MPPIGGIRPAGSLSELTRRVLSALVMALVVLAAAWTGGWPFAVIWLAAGIAIGLEGIDMARAQPRGLLIAVTALGLILLAIFTILGLAMSALLVALGCVAVLVVLGHSLRDRLWSAGGWLYAALVVCVPVAVREWSVVGLGGILWMFAVVWTTDIAAFFVGRRFGGPKLWARVSPGKTWSGFAGGLVAATLAGLLIAVVWRNTGHSLPCTLALVVVASALASIASQIGDLAESALKRLFAVKDSGSLIPGHGGVMDRLDGFAAVCLLAGLVLIGARLAAGQS